MSLELIKDLTEKRMNCFSQLKALVDLQAAEKRALTQVEQETFSAMNADMDKFKSQIDAEKSKLDNVHLLEVREAEIYSALKAGAVGPGLIIGDKPGTTILGGQGEGNKTEADKAKEIYAKQCEGLELYFHSDIKRKELEQYDLRQDVMTQGGYAVVAPVPYATEILNALRDQSVMRQLCDIMPALDSPGGWGQLTASSMGRPTRVGERQRAAFDTSLVFGQREMFTHDQELTQKITNKLLNNPNANMLGLVKEKMTESLADEQEYEFILADGVKKPLGFMYPSADGVPSSRQFSGGHVSGTAIGIDNFILLATKVHERLRAGGSYLVHTDVQYQMRIQKSLSSGDYYWQPSMVAGAPDRFNGYPVYTSNKMPATITSGSLVGAFANFSEYKILDSSRILISVEEHLYWETKETGISMTMFNDGQPRRAEAFAISKMP